MKLCKLDEIKGNEVIAKPILAPGYNVILFEGTILKLEYVKKLHELGIEEVFIEEEDNSEEVVLLKQDLEINIKNRVKDILEKHTYKHGDGLIKICSTANCIISSILSEKQMLEQIFDIKQRSADIYEHSITVCTMAIILSLKLDLAKDAIQNIGIACLLHDLGHRYLINSANNVDIREMDDRDALEYRKHPIYGYTALKEERWISNISKNIVLQHHERLDGTGYPLKLRKMSEEVQIVAVCDAFDEMICGIGSKRYKVYEAIEYLKAFKNILFSGRIVDVLLEFVAVYPVGTKVKTNLGEEAIVYKQNKGFPERPYMRIIKDANGEEVTEKRIINLADSLTVFIDQILN